MKIGDSKHTKIALNNKRVADRLAVCCCGWKRFSLQHWRAVRNAAVGRHASLGNPGTVVKGVPTIQTLFLVTLTSWPNCAAVEMNIFGEKELRGSGKCGIFFLAKFAG